MFSPRRYVGQFAPAQNPWNMPSGSAHIWSVPPVPPPPQPPPYLVPTDWRERVRAQTTIRLSFYNFQRGAPGSLPGAPVSGPYGEGFILESIDVRGLGLS